MSPVSSISISSAEGEGDLVGSSSDDGDGGGVGRPPTADGVRSGKERANAASSFRSSSQLDVGSIDAAVDSVADFSDGNGPTLEGWDPPIRSAAAEGGGGGTLAGVEHGGGAAAAAAAAVAPQAAERRKTWLEERESATAITGPTTSMFRSKPTLATAATAVTTSGGGSSSGGVKNGAGEESDVAFSSDSEQALQEQDEWGIAGASATVGANRFTLSPEAMLREGKKLRELSASSTAPVDRSGRSATPIQEPSSPAASELADFMDELNDVGASTIASPSGRWKAAGSDIAEDRSSISFSAGTGSPRGEVVPKDDTMHNMLNRAGVRGKQPSLSSNRSQPQRKSEHIDPDKIDPLLLVLPGGAQRAQAVSVEYDGPPGTLVISWEFYTDGPVRFGLFLKDTPTSTKQRKWTSCIAAGISSNYLMPPQFEYGVRACQQRCAPRTRRVFRHNEC